MATSTQSPFYGLHLATCSYREYKKLFWDDPAYVPVRTSIGDNWRHFPGIDRAESLYPWATFKKMDGASVHDQAAAYQAQLREHDADIRAEINELALGSNTGKTLVFLCYEVLTEKGKFCHRTWLADWFRMFYNYDMVELGAVPAPASPAGQEATLL